MRIRLLAVLLGALLVAGCGSDDDEKDAGAKATPTAAASPSPTPTAEPTGCQKVKQPKPKKTQLDKPSAKLDADKEYTAVVTTSCGEFRIALDVKQAPKTASSFAYLARKGFYDGTTFHRIIPGFVIQGGDPKGTGMGGPGYKVTEAPPQGLTYDVGVVAMAKTGADPAGASGSQFFVVTGEGGLNLPPEYALVGRISGGEDAVGSIATAPTSAERPVDPIVIESVTIEEK